MCNSLPTLTIVQNIFSIKTSLIRKTNLYWLTTQKAKRGSTLPHMEVLNLTPYNFEDMHTTFTSLVIMQISLSEISLDYLLHPDSLGG